ncbi:MAG TPA: molybdopterin cofactor-binding domain-containing protein [Woeseiaceae bacterium]|nr:molybdopterin cofactor-binding domain-containing protein [Woeseiaceae bacterium]
MTVLLDEHLSRRSVLRGGALTLSFTLFPGRLLAQDDEDAQDVRSTDEPELELPGSLGDDPFLESWIRIEADNSITVFTGKVELGQGIKTALLQVAAEELYVSPSEITLVTADTARTPDEGFTAGSQSMQDSATALLHAAAQVRAILTDLAAERFDVAPEQLRLENRTLVAPDGRTLTYGELVAGRLREVQARPTSPLKDPVDYTVIGRDLPRVDIPAKVTGGAAYVHDLRLPELVHARVVRPPSYGARLGSLETAEVEQMPGVLQIVRNGSFLAVVAEQEWQAVQAMRAIGRSATWHEEERLPSPEAIFDFMHSLRSEERVIHEAGTRQGGTTNVIEAEYFREYQMHASIGPSCAVGLYQDGMLTVWTHSQGVYPLREAIAEMLDLPLERVRCIHAEGSGCYGHNGADDAGGDAALIAVAHPGRPVRVQWMREDEHRWEPYGSAMHSRARARLNGQGRIVDWSYEVWSNTHSTRPGGAGALSCAWLLEDPIPVPPAEPIPQPTGGGDRNAIPLYALPNARIVHHFIPEMPLRVSALRALGGYMNVFALESFMDELAAAAGADPVEFRLRHLEDERARDVVLRAAEAFDWPGAEGLPDGHGRGFGFARYKNLAAYCAVAVEVSVARESGKARVLRAVAAIDSGSAVNPDAIRNQTEGGIVQSSSWTLLEQVRFDRTRITSRDWSTYPIMRMRSVPESVEVHVIDRPGAPYLGTGEAAQGPAAAAIANAVANASGKRIRHIPLTPDRIKAAMAA